MTPIRPANQPVSPEPVPVPDAAARPSAGNPVRVGIIGYGYWGPNIARNFSGLENCHLVAVCDKSTA